MANQDLVDQQDYKDYQDYQTYKSNSEPTALETGLSVPRAIYKAPLTQSILGAIGTVGAAVDPYTLGPARAATSDVIGNVQQGIKSPSRLMGSAINKFANSFGAGGFLSNEKPAPTETDIAAQLGASTENTPLSGLIDKITPYLGSIGSESPPSDQPADNGLYSKTPGPLQLHKGGDYDPEVSPAGLIGQAAAFLEPGEMNAIGLLGKAISGGANLMKNIPTGPTEDLGGLVQGVNNLPNVAGELLSHVPKSNIGTIRDRYPDVQALVHKYGDNSAQAVEDFRSDALDSVKQAKDQWNGHIDNFVRDIQEKGNTPSMEIGPVVKNIKEIRDELPEEFSRTSNISDRLKSFKKQILSFDGDKDGRVSPYNAWEIYNETKEMMKSEIPSGKGKLYSPSGPELQAARSANRYAREYLSSIDNENGDLGTALKNHSDLHDIEDSLRSSALKEGSATNPLITAGSYSGDPIRNQLGKLGKLTGEDFITPLENISAYQNMYVPKHVGGFYNSVGHPITQGLIKATQPGFTGTNGAGYWNTIRGLLRESRLKQQSQPRQQDQE